MLKEHTYDDSYNFIYKDGHIFEIVITVVLFIYLKKLKHRNLSNIKICT